MRQENPSYCCTHCPPNIIYLQMYIAKLVYTTLTSTKKCFCSACENRLSGYRVTIFKIRLSCMLPFHLHQTNMKQMLKSQIIKIFCVTPVEAKICHDVILLCMLRRVCHLIHLCNLAPTLLQIV